MKRWHQILLLGFLVQSAAFAANDEGGAKSHSGPPKKEFKHTLKLNGLERKKDSITINIPNDGDQRLAISGVQSSPSLFVVDFDKFIDAGKTGKVVLAYDAQEGAVGGSDYIRVRTNFGIRMVQVDIDRPSVVEFSAQELVWPLGQPISTKSVMVTVSNRTTAPKSVRVHGKKNQAAIVALGEGKYRIDVTPGSTTEAGSFPVVIEFDPQVPGVSPVVICSVK